MPLVSVIIPTFNRGWILKEAIDSVLSQTFTDYELIVVDDGSTDNTPDILKSYPQTKLIRQENRGVSAARNKGVKASAGKYLAFLDSDDLWLPGKLEKQVNFFNKNPDANICQTEEIWIRNGTRVNPKKKHLKPSGTIFEKCLGLCLVSPSAVMMTREVFDEAGGFDETLPACEDYDLWLRLTCKYPVYLIEEPLTIKRGGHKDQLSKMPCLDKFRIKSLEKILKRGNLNPQQYEAAVKALEEKCRIYASGCEKRGRYTEARYYRHLPIKFQ
ncbi:MAG: glycosyltransferase family 2 protein [Deltaproteobacteria bacterium]|nr:MAG: glycosyltransferase family 2 protein [Deltaproteobacteria bacterium]